MAPPAISKLLVANRGEIACRVFQTARRLGIPSVAVYSEADRDSKHVSLADEAICIGPAPARDSYLRADRLLEAAVRTGASAVHPGYGFLSENTDFAGALEAERIAFVGPPASAIKAMGDKAAAKAVMSAANVAVVPGYHGEEQGEEFLLRQAREVGYPLLVKAVLGGGGKGMKLARSESEFLEALRSARREALAAFGDERVLLERFVLDPRHVEVQVMADSLGNAVHLHERDCSVQRRHQKVVEEAPAPGLSRQQRRDLGASAVAAALAVGYRNAGTVEFIMDGRSGEFYFMEMNTRLQVEHPVTEAITGVDLVEWQLRVAAGEALPRTQDQILVNGHAFEARIYAENPANNFLPAGGTLARWATPPGAAEFVPGAPLRVDSGVRVGDGVGLHYDPMIAKLVVHGPSRAEALAALDLALAQCQVSGLPTNIEFVRRVAQNEAFQRGGVDTGFIAQHEDALLGEPVPTEALRTARLHTAALAGLVALLRPREAGRAPGGAWGARDADGWTSLPGGVRQGRVVELTRGSETWRLEWMPGCEGEEPASRTLRAGSLRASVKKEGREAWEECTTLAVKNLTLTPAGVAAELDGAGVRAAWSEHAAAEEQVLDLWAGASGGQAQFRRPLARRWARRGGGGVAVGGVRAPMPGRVVKVFAAAGDRVEEGAPLVALEAMKMEHVLRAPCAGIVEEVAASVGIQVDDGAVLAVVVADGE